MFSDLRTWSGLFLTRLIEGYSDMVVLPYTESPAYFSLERMSVMVAFAHLRLPLGLGIREASSSFLIRTMLQPCSYQPKILLTISASFSLTTSFFPPSWSYPKQGLENAGESGLLVLFLIPHRMLPLLSSLSAWARAA